MQLRLENIKSRRNVITNLEEEKLPSFQKIVQYHHNSNERNKIFNRNFFRDSRGMSKLRMPCVKDMQRRIVNQKVTLITQKHI